MLQTNKNATNWRKTVQQNSRKSYFVIALFLIIFFALGLLIDLISRYIQFNSGFVYGRIPLGRIAEALFSLQLTPWATIISSAIALIWLVATFSYYDKIMLSGTNARQIYPDDSDPFCRRIYHITEEMKIAANLAFMPKVYLIDADYMNAFAAGFSEKSSMIAVTRKLAESLNREELQAVIAHELTHIRNQDIKLNLFTVVLANMLMFMLEFLFWSLAFSGNRGSRRDNNGNNVIAIFLLVVMILRFVLPLITGLLMLFLSRTREYMADAGAVELMRDNRPIAKALIKISENHQSAEAAKAYKKTAHERMRRASYIFDPAKAKFAASTEDWFSTHPSLTKRLRAIGFRR